MTTPQAFLFTTDTATTSNEHPHLLWIHAGTSDAVAAPGSTRYAAIEVDPDSEQLIMSTCCTVAVNHNDTTLHAVLQSSEVINMIQMYLQNSNVVLLGRTSSGTYCWVHKIDNNNTIYFTKCQHDGTVFDDNYRTHKELLSLLCKCCVFPSFSDAI